MSQAKLKDPVAALSGAINRRGSVCRRKMFYDENHKLIAEGKQELYIIGHPRDFKTTPPQGAELANINCWREACQRAAQILRSAQADPQNGVGPLVGARADVPAYYTPEEAQELLADFRRRFNAQLPGVRGSHPDPQALLDKVTHRPKRYLQLPSFIRAMIYSQLKNAASSALATV